MPPLGREHPVSSWGIKDRRTGNANLMCSFLSPLPEKAIPLITPGKMGFFGVFEKLPGTQAGWP